MSRSRVRTGPPARRTPAKALVAAVAVAVATLAAASTASAAVVVNEVESSGVVDFVELVNTDGATVDIGNYVIRDGGGNSFTIPAGTMLAGNGFYLANALGFGLGEDDSAALYAAGDLVNSVDTYAWTTHAAATYGRCPDGTGPMKSTSSATPGAANDCPGAPVAALPWPGGETVSVADGGSASDNLSGLAYQASGTATRGVLWAVRNDPSVLYRMVYDGTKWGSDTTNGWSAGKSLRYTGGAGAPDAEGVTLADGEPNAVYVATERDGGGGSRPAVLRYDVSQAGPSLTATNEWNLTGDLPALGANLGLEAIAWVPDSLLVSKGLVDDSTGAKYSPAAYPDHGAGLFFVGVEQDGKIIAYALNRTAGTFKRVATVASGFPAVMDLEYEPESTHLWAVCDDTCDGRTATLDIAQTGPNAGHFVVTNTFERPAGMPNLNNEGFAIAPQAECVGGFKPVIWADDSDTGGNELRAGSLECTVLDAEPEPTPTVTSESTPTPTPETLPAPRPNPAPECFCAPPAPAPQRVALKFSKSGTYAVRRTGKFGVEVTLASRADLTITVATRKNAKAKAKTILKTTRKGVAAGTRTFKLTLTKRARASLRKGQTVTLTVKARSGAGVKTYRATAKVQ